MVALDQHPLARLAAGDRLSQDRDEYGFETGLDWRSPDHIDEAEAAGLRTWYEDSHGPLELTPFVPFLIETLPGALKRYRRYPQTIHETGGLPQLAIALLFLHLYMVERSVSGVRYQVIAAKRWGATRAEVISTIHLGFLNGGPLAGSAAAEAATDLLREWDESEPRTVESPWPDGWSAERPAAPPEDAQATAASRFLGVHAPAVLRARMDRSDHLEERWGLPAQMRPLMHLHLAAAKGRAEDAAVAASRARQADTGKEATMEALAFAMLYLDEIALDRVCETIQPVFDAWG
jgi:alkylhydroperoxidase/carboxymuconolactone decarboxylase family protein YurZ